MKHSTLQVRTISERSEIYFALKSQERLVIRRRRQFLQSWRPCKMELRSSIDKSFQSIWCLYFQRLEMYQGFHMKEDYLWMTLWFVFLMLSIEKGLEELTSTSLPAVFKCFVGLKLQNLKNHSLFMRNFKNKWKN